jgi:hypothetical protein
MRQLPEPNVNWIWVLTLIAGGRSPGVHSRRRM